MYLYCGTDLARTNGIVKHGEVRVQSPLSVPAAVTKKTSASCLQVPSASRQMPPTHSSSTAHPRQARAVGSQIGESEAHCASDVQATHAPSLAQYGCPAMPTHSSSVAHFATQS